MKNLILDKAKAGELLTERELMELGFKCESGILSSYKKDCIEFTFCGGELSSIYIDDEDIENIFGIEECQGIDDELCHRITKEALLFVYKKINLI